MIIGNYLLTATSTDTPQVLDDIHLLDVAYRLKAACPFRKDDGDVYFNWKLANLPIVWFTHAGRRPRKSDRHLYPTGFALIDIDCGPGIEIETHHPAVYAVNRTKNGVHILVHAMGFGGTNKGWTDTYHSVAFSVWSELHKKHTDIRLDPKSRFITQGCFLWNTVWRLNEGFNPKWKPPQESVAQEILDLMYTSHVEDTSEEPNSSNTFNLSDKDIARSGFSDELLRNFQKMDYGTFLEYYGDDFSIVTGDTPRFTPHTDYEGNVTEMCRSDGSLSSIWFPYMSRGGGNVTAHGRIKKGHRRVSIYTHLVRVCKFLGEDRIDCDYLLYDAVSWVHRCCEDGDRFPKKELFGEVVNAIAGWRTDTKHNTYTDRRKYICGEFLIDPSTGEEVPMEKGTKIGRSAKMRKTDRILEVLYLWFPKCSFEENIAELLHHTGLTRKTLLDYLRRAKANAEYVSRYPWLVNLKFPSRGGRNQGISIRDKDDGTVYVFRSKAECLAFLKVSKPTFIRFTTGSSKLNRRWELL